MFRHLLIATDGSAPANTAVQHGIALAASVGARVTVVTVTEPWSALFLRGDDLSFPEQEYAGAMAAQAASRLDAACRDARRQGVTCSTEHVCDSFAAEGIVAEADKLDVDLIVMGTHGWRGLRGLLLGSQTQRVLTMTRRPVLVCR